MMANKSIQFSENPWSRMEINLTSIFKR